MVACFEKAAKFWSLSMDETGEYYEDWEIDWEKLSEMVEKSLVLKKSEVNNE